MPAMPSVSAKTFALFCLASFLLSLSYGSTFLLSLLIHSRGGNEHDAGSVISTAMLSTFVAVVLSGYLADALGAARAIAGMGILLGIMLGSIALFAFGVSGNLSYLLAAALLGVGYGLTYSVINGLVAHEAPSGMTSQALSLFSLAYFVGVFGFPWLAGKLIVDYGLWALMISVLAVATCNWLISVARLAWRRVSAHKILQVT